MSFLKRHISKEQLISTYIESGIEGVKTLLRGADALFYDDLFSGTVIDIYHGEDMMFDTWKQIEKLIIDELPN